MKRKDFLKNIFLGSAGTLVATPLPAESEPAKQKIRLAVTFIAGFQHYDGPDAESLLEIGMPLQLNREPHNNYDKNAVEVWTGDAKLGYVPRSENKTIARLMDKGVGVEASVLELDPSAFPNSVKLELFYFKNIEQ
jgi:hypothetical protein